MVMEVGYELARRGHVVTVVSPFKNKKEGPGVIYSEFVELSDRMTEDTR
jgi:hypothetical protein